MDGRVKPGHDRGGWAAVLSPSPAGLTRGSIVLRKNSLRRRWMAGSSPAMTTVKFAPTGSSPAMTAASLLGNLVVEVTPVRIHRENEIDLPLARPVLDVLFPLDCSGGRVVALIVNQHLNPVAFGEAWYEAFPVLKGPTHQIIGDADVQRAAATISQDIDPETHSTFPVTRGLDPRVHLLRKIQGYFRKTMDCRVKLGNDDRRSSPAMTEEDGPQSSARHPRA